MGNFELLLNGFSTVLLVENLIACVFGAILGLFVGAMPGIGSLAGTALLLPLTFGFHPTTGIILLGTFYYSNMYGGAYGAILLNVPGDSPAIMTALDGYPMATKLGRPSQALFASNLASFIGGTIGIVVLTFSGPWIAVFGLRFGPAEMTALLLVAMTSVGWLVGDNPTKGVVVTALGVVLASIGMDAITGSPRFHFGSMYLLGGIPFIPFVIGAVGFAQVIKLMEDRNRAFTVEQKISIRNSLLSKNEFKRMIPPTLRSSVVGNIVGVLPGAGATTGAFLGYAAQKAFKSEVELGKGAIEGIAACESANSAAAAGSFAPLLALGIPGSGTGAVLLGGLIMWGLNPGPLLFTNQPDFAWGLIASLYLANIITLITALLLIPYLVKVLTVPIKYLIPAVTVVCIVGAYSSTNSMYGVLIMLLAGIMGYMMDKNKYPIAPMLLAFVLAPLLETNMRRALLMSRGNMGIFFNSGISMALMATLCIIVVTPILRAVLRALWPQKP